MIINGDSIRGGKMELLYVWARNKNGEYKFNFDLNNDYKVEITKVYNGVGAVTREDIKIISSEKEKVNIFNASSSNGTKQIYGLIGKNGSGKTTLLKSLLKYDFFEDHKKKT